MEVASSVMEVLFLFSEALLYPAILLLIALVIWALVMIGQVVSEYSGRVRDIGKIREAGKQAHKEITADNPAGARKAFTNIPLNPMVRKFVTDISGFFGDSKLPIEAEKLLQDYELIIGKELQHLKILTRTAPMLGLMGTLIPLGPALMGLSSGNIQALASNLVVAFSTTVLGLLVGGIAYAIMVVRRGWYFQDFSDMEYIVEGLE
ncbi:MotA/TolQ/ExbB proton channel family protein [Methanogenium organophilum]|uniref:MotA/TolQ/ExbB proton channel family protein n=1 Tax=Methanogenium organophilum TaxID=2199 RepID=A0A9X9S4X5_METOG|nr:MotA/TolQ/ExbB proton channel family protein [Methanogenium organophilum]WAI01741.1 MotA/TolQ/ExbB proton channel family protein [Methanogenium organophilum]